MYKYIFRRVLEAIPTVLILITLTFFLVRLAPGSPFTSDRAYPPEIIANIEAKYHLNEPLWKQYLIYLSDFFQGNLGPSFKYKDFTVNQLIAQSFGPSFKLGAIAYVIVSIGGIVAGVTAALHQNTKLDHGLITVLVIGSVIPPIVLAPVLIYTFAVKLNWLPSGGWNDGALPNLVLPLITYIYGSFVYLARMTRGNMIEALNSNFVRTARAKGLPHRVVVWKHTIRAAAVPVIQILTVMFIGFISGAVITEQIYGIPGLGQLYVQGATNRDYGLVLALTTLSGVLFVIANIVNDIILAAIDPRVKF